MNTESLIKALAASLNDPTAPHAELNAAIGNQPELLIFAKGNTFILPGWVGGVSYESLATWMVSRASTVGVMETIGDLTDFLTASRIPVWQGAILAGIRIPQSIDLGKGMALLPFDQVSFLGTGLSPYERHRASANCAVLVHISEWPRSHFLQPRDGAILPEDFEMSSDVAISGSLLGVLLGVPVVRINTWSTTADWVPCVPHRSRALLSYDLVQGETKTLSLRRLRYASALHKRYWNMRESVRDVLHVPIVRLNTAMNKLDVDCAIDLGIALESIFLSDSNEGELAYRLSVRAARFLGKSSQRRRAVFKTFKMAYTLRSKAVHTGSIYKGKSDHKRFELLSCLMNTQSLVVTALRRIIRAGELPDWDELTLGGN
jgi:hypothetical protein